MAVKLWVFVNTTVNVCVFLFFLTVHSQLHLSFDISVSVKANRSTLVDATVLSCDWWQDHNVTAALQFVIHILQQKQSSLRNNVFDLEEPG